MKKACLIGLLQFLVPIAVYAALLWRRLEWPINLFASLFLGVFMAVAIGLIWKAIHQMQDYSLLKSSTGGMPARTDGKRTAVFGKIYPFGEAAIAPFSGAQCVCCVWGIYHWVVSGSGKNRSRSKQYMAQGHVLIPSFIRTGLEDVKLLGFPHLEGFPQTDYGDAETDFEARRKAAEYLNRMPLEEKKGISDVKEVFSEIKDLMTDSDGAVRKEYRNVAADDIPQDTTLEEQYVPPGAEICLMGKWSADQRGIVPEDMASGKQVTIRKGTPDAVASSLRTGFIARLIGGLILASAVNALIWFLVQKFPGA